MSRDIPALIVSRWSARAAHCWEEVAIAPIDTQVSGGGRRTVELAAVCGLTVLSLTLFGGKAFHIDDPYYVWVAQHIAGHPLDYYGLTINWYGWPMHVYEMHVSPPLVPYSLALWGTLFGWSEWSLHIAYLPAAVVFVAGTYSLAARFCGNPLLASLVTLFSPVTLVSATNVMLDLPMAAFFVASIALWCEGIDSGRRGLLILACVAVGLSALCKYFGIAALPLLCLYAIARRRHPGHWLPPLLIPIGCIALEQLASYSLYHRSLFVNAVNIAGTAANPAFYRIATGLSFAGGCMFGAIAFSFHMRPRQRRIAASAGIAAVAASFVAIILHWNPSDNPLPPPSVLQLAVFVIGGTIVFALALDDLRIERSAESALLGCWVLGTFVFAALINWSITARTLLPMAPAVAILISRRLERCHAPALLRSYTLPLLACIAVSFACGAADYAWAGSMRDVARGFIAESKRHSGSVYFQGHWGWQYYMEQGGLRPMDWAKFSFQPGDFLVSPQNNTNVEAIDDRVAYGVQTTEYQATRWLTFNSQRLGAGYYSDMFGPLPFALGTVPPDRYSVILLGMPKTGASEGTIR